MQTRALVRLGADACIVGRSAGKTEDAAADIALVRPGARVIGIGGCDVRKVRALSPLPAPFYFPALFFFLCRGKVYQS